MRLSLTLAAPFLVLLAAGGVQAAASPEAINGVLANCPAAGSAEDCSSAVSSFANGLTDSDRDSDLLSLATALAQKAQGAPEACVEFKAGIQAAADAASDGVRLQIAGLGDPLCDDVDTSETGSIMRQDDYLAPQSLIAQPDPDDAN